MRGEVVLPDGGPPISSADVLINVEDISRADAPSMVVGSSRQEGVSLVPGANLPFAIEVPETAVDDKHLYVVTVHVDVSRNGRVQVGDLITQQNYPVLTRGYSDVARVRVKAV